MIKLEKLKKTENEDIKIIKEHYGIKTNAGATRKAIKIAANHARIEKQVLENMRLEVKNQTKQK